MNTPLIPEEDWIFDAKAALNWLIEEIGADNWTVRRKNLIEYFTQVKILELGEGLGDESKLVNGFKPIAVYDDWLGWYMYLIESIGTRPYCDDPFQSARIYPFFAAIGKNLKVLNMIPGLDARKRSLVNEKQNQPDSTLYELLVAAAYQREGWSVEFLQESKSGKMPDLKITKGNRYFYVECKRLAKINSYAEDERQLWQSMSKHLSNDLHLANVSGTLDIKFFVGLETLPETFLKEKAISAFREQGVERSFVRSWPELEIRYCPLDISKINEVLERSSTRAASPNFIAMFWGDYDMHGQYTNAASFTKYEIVNEEDELSILNYFVAGVSWAVAYKWTCVSENSIDKKAKDVKKLLSKAVSQIPDNEPGIVHIGYETVSGPYVETIRHEKIKKTVKTFDYGEKRIENIIFNSIQPLVDLGRWECAETPIFFAKKTTVLQDLMLLAPANIEQSNETHWQQDIETMKKKE